MVRFATAEDAAAAAIDIASVYRAPTTSESLSHTYHPIPIPRYPNTLAVGVDEDPNSDYDRPQVVAVTAVGPYALIQEADRRVAGLDWAVGEAQAADLVAATLDAQRPVIEKFSATPVDQLVDLPQDPDGLPTRTVPSESPSVQDGVYGPHAALHFESEPPASQAAFAAAGLRQVVDLSSSRIYLTRDVEVARQLRQKVAESAGGYQPAAGVPGIPAARCRVKTDKSNTTYDCVAVSDRYVFEGRGKQEAQVHQLLSAQYLMLTAK